MWSFCKFPILHLKLQPCQKGWFVILKIWAKCRLCERICCLKSEGCREWGGVSPVKELYITDSSHSPSQPQEAKFYYSSRSRTLQPWDLCRKISVLRRTDLPLGTLIKWVDTCYYCINMYIMWQSGFVSGSILCMESHCDGQKFCERQNIPRKEVCCHPKKLVFASFCEYLIFVQIKLEGWRGLLVPLLPNMPEVLVCIPAWCEGYVQVRKEGRWWFILALNPGQSHLKSAGHWWPHKIVMFRSRQKDWKKI